ncbi:MAG TPA: ABC transporter substrate-binding protein [Acidimicrobiia bacterium]|nr:ABC transporter substrate-binding protein [Acidimicrobiia bacterium]
MTDEPRLPGDPEPGEPEFPLAGLDAERPLPAELRARLEAALLAAVGEGLPVPADAESLDAPRPLPEPVRARLEAALLAEAAVSAAGEVVPLDGRRRRAFAVWSSVAAVVFLVIAVAGLALRGGGPGSGDVEVAGGATSSTVPTSAPLPSGAEVPTGVQSPAAVPATTATTRAPRPGRTTSTTARPPGTTTTVPAGPGAPTAAPTAPGAGTADPPAPAPASTDPGPPPPFDNSSEAALAGPPAATTQPGGSAGAAPQGDSAPPQKSASPTTGTVLRIGIVTGDAAQEAGFRAYVNRLNQAGGVRGHTLELVPVSAGSPAANLVATVNLSPQPVAGPGGAPGWATGPLLETLTAPESVLTGDVFSFASPPERQGHLAADALFPSAVSSQTRAVIYAAPSGPLADVVPQAMKAVLDARGVAVTIHTYDPAKNPGLVSGADAALLSLDPAAARAWVAQAKAAGHRPARGIAGIWSLFDETLAPDLPDSARVVSPYVVPGGDEGQAIRSGAGGSSASVLHGWAGAKALAAAVWRTGADTPAELRAALEGLAGWSSGLAPAYETRPGTRARTPEGVLFQVQSGTWAAQGGFRRDPY